MEHNENTALKLITQAMPEVALPEAAPKTETQLVRAVVARVVAKSDCECTMQGSTTWSAERGFVTTYAYVDHFGRNWGYDSTCGGQVKPANQD